MVDAILGVVFHNLTSLLQNEFSTISVIKSKAEKLSNTLDLTKAVLQDAEHKQFTDHSVNVWLQQLKDAVYVLDDILDECSIQSGRLKGLSSFTPKNIIFRRSIGNRLKEITSRFDNIADRKNRFFLQEGVTVKERGIEVAEWRQTSSIISEPKVYGREDDKEKIVEFLLTQARDCEFSSVYPIIGLGGVGKTTLAQLVYNDVRVSSNFHTKIWVCVSENFSVKRILCSIIESITREKCDALDLDVIQRKAQELLQGKRYLLVLDDVWNRNQQFILGLSQDKWNKLKSVLSCGSKGSSVLVSTRDKDVASILGTCQTHHLSGLSENECWLLFKQYAFGHDNEEREELVAIGKEIVKKCGGLPLAAQALGGLMRSRSGEKEWLDIKESKLWSLSDENSILPALRLSYFHLTSTLKQCFSFCAIFPKDTEILKEDLIHLWMANGFISSSKGNLEVEDIGNMIWNELCQKSFFQVIKMGDYSRDISFKMHDLVHDLAQSVVGSGCMTMENTSHDLSRSTHHISVHHTYLSSVNEVDFNKLESLRTLYQLELYGTRFSGCFPAVRSLRVLRVRNFKLSSLGSLIHLRYLELHNLKIKMLPNSIYNLHKLEILKLKHLSDLRYLPERLTCLKNLRHLIIEDCFSLSRMFPYIGKLSCLRTLSVYIVRSKTGHNLAQLHDLKLEGKLSIVGLENVSSLSDVREANLMSKKDLHELCLSWSNNGKTKKLANCAKEVLHLLQPHSNLKCLRILHYDGLYFPSWIEIHSSLVYLELRSCKNCVQLPPLRKLPFLKQLSLGDMDKVRYVDIDESHDGARVGVFPSLEKLSLLGLPNLECLLAMQKGGMFLRLSDLTICGCPKLVLPCLPSLKDLTVIGCNNELLRPISCFHGLTTLLLSGGNKMTSLPEGMLRGLTCLQTLIVTNFPKLKELPNEPLSLALERLEISRCGDLESLPEQILEGLQSLRTIEISSCGLRSLPECIRDLASLEVLTISDCPALKDDVRNRGGR
ncbi:unnamed protein product [Trifolium pratense]|uniref:Uncharacterized protein n=1 Tax=Trifolium pratense TaxID=57577 RepID=A0ACB0K5G3_TRIPR|nr:unnamed protein product [Trifolium pratense]